MRTFAQSLKAEIEHAKTTNSAVSRQLGATPTFISNVIGRNAVSETYYRKLLNIFPHLNAATLPSNMQEDKRPKHVPGEDTKKLGELLRKVRESRGITQRAVGKKAGLSGRYISELERGNYNPSPTTIEKLTKVFPELADKKAAVRSTETITIGMILVAWKRITAGAQGENVLLLLRALAAGVVFPEQLLEAFEESEE
jgi:transcriptional regulator with XRE-family HTH domain